MFDLHGKVAVVTGGNGGIGLGFAEGLAEQGADVCIWGTNETKNTQALEALRKHGTKVQAIRCDVSDESQVVAAFSETVRYSFSGYNVFRQAAMVTVIHNRTHDKKSTDFSSSSFNGNQE